MAFVKVGGARKYYKYSEMNEGDTPVTNCVYLGEEEGKYGIQHLFRDDEGTVHVLNSAGHLNHQLEEYVSVGQRCNVTYLGKDKLTKGKFAGKEYHKFSVEADDSFVASPAATTATSPTDISL
jgi:hypothetical protein